MKTRHIHGVEVQESSGNVFADLGVADAEKLKIKTGLVIQIKKAMREQALTQQEAAKRMGITQPKVSDMMRGDFSNLSERAGKMLRDDIEALGAVKLRDVDDAQAAIVAQAKELAAQGQIEIGEGKDEEMVY